MREFNKEESWFYCKESYLTGRHGEADVGGDGGVLRRVGGHVGVPPGYVALSLTHNLHSELVTRCLRNYRKSILYMRLSEIGKVA